MEENMSGFDLFANLDEEPKEEVIEIHEQLKEVPEEVIEAREQIKEDVQEELFEDEKKEHDEEYEEIKDTNDVPFLDRLSNVIDEHDQNNIDNKFLNLDDSSECSSKFEEKKNEECKEDYSAFEREISEKDDEIRYLKTEISSLQNKIAEQNKTAEEMRKNKNVGFSEIVPSLEKIFNLIETRSNSKMLEFAQILVDEEKKSLYSKHDEDLLLIGELKSENMMLKNELQKCRDYISELEEKKKYLEEKEISLERFEERERYLERQLEEKAQEIEKRTEENKRLFQDNCLLVTKSEIISRENRELKNKL